jgi:hypothetical protein
MVNRTTMRGALVLAACLTAGTALAQTQTKAPPAKPPVAATTPPADHPESWARTRAAGRATGEIVTQPARDLGISKTEIPPVLAKAQTSPYSLVGIKTCKQIGDAIRALNVPLGPDFAAGPQEAESRSGKLAAAGGRAVVNTIIPFRGIVREVTGAAPAERRYQEAVDAGIARRGFLRGVYYKQACRPPF